MADSGDGHRRPSFEESWRQRFINFSASDDDAGIAGWSVSGLGARYRHFKRVWPGDAPGALWLDVGCGAGTYTRLLIGRGLRVIGMDYSFPTIIKARARSNGAAGWSVADATRLPVKASTFDGVMCFGVIQALADSSALMQELSRAVKPAGWIWVDALNSRCLPSLWDRWRRRLQGRPPHLRYESPSRLRRMMMDQGCGDVVLYWVPILPQRLQRYQRLLEGRVARAVLRYFPVVGSLVSHAFVLQGRKAALSGHNAGG